MYNDYNSSGLQAGRFITISVKASADTYYKGMPLGRVDSTSVFGYLNTGDSTGLENFKAVCIEDKVLSSEGTIQVAVTGSDVRSSALVDDAGAKYTVTEAIRQNALDNGMILR